MRATVDTLMMIIKVSPVAPSVIAIKVARLQLKISFPIWKQSITMVFPFSSTIRNKNDVGSIFSG